MEHAPLIPEAPKVESKDSEDDEKDKKKKDRGFLELFNNEGSEKSDRDKAEESKESQKDSKDKEEPGLFEIEKPKAEEAEIEVEPASEAEAPDESLGEAEAADVVKELARQRAEQIEVPAAVETDPDVAEELAAQMYLENAQQSGDPEQSLMETAAELGVPEAEMAALEEGAVTENPDPEAIEQMPDAEAEEALPTDEEGVEASEPEESEVVFDRSTEAAETETEEPVAAAGSPPQPLAGTTSSSGSRGASTTGSGASGPGGPHGPAGPGLPFSPFGPGGPGGGAPSPAAGFNALPTPAAANTATTPPTPELDDRANPAAMALFGGIIGYLIGRRRGRIKTEKRLLPVQKKLEKQVQGLQFELHENEKKIRRLAREKAEQGAVATEALAAKAANAKAERIAKPPTVIEKVVKQTGEKPQRAERVKAPEARQLHTSTVSEKRIGRVLMAAEAPILVRSETPRETINPKQTAEKVSHERSADLIANRRIETLNRQELLDISERIMVDGTSLRQIYETKLIGERGLRRLVAEHLRGGDVKKALRQEIIEREIDFERDPVLRDMATTSIGGGNGGKAALEKMLSKVEVPGADKSEQAAYFKARAAYETQQREQHQKQRQLMDISLTAIILMLVVLVIYLIVTRG